MRGFEYVTILFSVLLGLSISRLLVGAGRAIVDPVRRLHWLPGLWTVQLFVFQVVLWWLVFQRADLATWSFAHYLITITYPVLFFFLAVLLYPGLDSLEEGTTGSFLARRRWFYGLLLILLFVDVGENALAEGIRSPARAATSPAAGLVIFGIAMWTENRVYHAVIAVVAVALVFGSAITLLPTIG